MPCRPPGHRTPPTATTSAIRTTPERRVGRPNTSTPVRTLQPQGSRPLPSFAAFGEPQPAPFTLGPAQPTTVTGATVAFRYQLTRPGGFEATAIDAWISQSGAEMWLLVHTDPTTSATILATLKA